MEYVFILGKNPGLSLAEIVSYFQARSVGFRVREISEGWAVIDADRLPQNMPGDLGGTLKVAEVMFSADAVTENTVSDIGKHIDFHAFLRYMPEKPTFGVSSYGSGAPREQISRLFREKMKHEGMKPGIVHSGEFMTHTEVTRRRLLDKGMEIVLFTGKRFWLARTLHAHNPFDFRKRDLERPSQRPVYSIPPRLCRIMINLAGVPSGVLLDPFCGIGTILQEAALMGYDIRGIDSDKSCVKGCINNFEWLEVNYDMKFGAGSKVTVGDARKLTQHFEEKSVDLIVTEPYLGPPLEQRPSYKRAEKILNELVPLYEDALKGMAAVVRKGGSIVIVSPSFRTGNGSLRLPIEDVADKLGLSACDPLEKQKIEHGFPYRDFSERHNTIREMSILRRM